MVKIFLKKAKIYFFLFIVSFGVFSSFSSAQAYEAWPNLSAQIFKQTLEEAFHKIEAAKRAAIKEISYTLITSQVNNLITESSLIINDWQEFLIEEPLNKANVYLDDLLTISSRSRTSNLNYNFASASGNKSYVAQLENNTRRKIQEGEIGFHTIDIDEYLPDPSDIKSMFSDGSWRAYNAFISNPANNPYGHSLMVEERYYNYLAQQEKEAQTRAIAGKGYKDKTKDGYVITPGATIADIYRDVLNIGNNIVASAGSIPEIITASVSRVLTQAINQGIGDVQRNINRNISHGIRSIIR